MSVLRRAIQVVIAAKKATTSNPNHKSAWMEDVRCSTVRYVKNQESRGATNASMVSTLTHFKRCARVSNVLLIIAKVVLFQALIAVTNATRGMSLTVKRACVKTSHVS